MLTSARLALDGLARGETLSERGRQRVVIAQKALKRLEDLIRELGGMPPSNSPTDS